MELWNYPREQKTRLYEIEAIQIPIVYNGYGDHDPDGLPYVLKKDAERVRRAAWENFLQMPPKPAKEVQPLVIRANVGDRIQVIFTHSLKPGYGRYPKWGRRDECTRSVRSRYRGSAGIGLA